MHFPMTRRSVLAALAAAVPALAASKGAKAWTASTQNTNFPVASGLWKTLEHATDGTDPSTALSDPPAPKFTPEILALSGKEIELTGYLTPLSAGGFGKKPEYLLSRENFHCPYCYAFGRGSLALADFTGHVPAANGKVTVKATLALQQSDPSDFYFQLKNAKIT